MVFEIWIFTEYWNFLMLSSSSCARAICEEGSRNVRECRERVRVDVPRAGGAERSAPPLDGSLPNSLEYQGRTRVDA